MSKLSFVIPCYHSADTVGGVVAEIRETVARRPGTDYEIILVNDNPSDATWQALERLTREDPRICAVCFSRNFGQHAALMAGYRQVTGEIVVSLDDDSQNPAGELFRLVDALDEDHDVAYARYPVRKRSPLRNLAGNLSYRMMDWLMDKPKDLSMSSYYAAKRFIIDEMVRCDSPFPFVDGLAVRSTAKFANVEMELRPRQKGRSGYTMRKLVRLWSNMLTSFSIKPLRVASVTGFGFSLLGGVIGLVLILRKLILKDQVDPGWTSLMAMMFFLSGILMMMIGLVGEYVGRIFMTLNRSPQYVIKHRIPAGSVPPEEAPSSDPAQKGSI